MSISLFNASMNRTGHRLVMCVIFMAVALPLSGCLIFAPSKSPFTNVHEQLSTSTPAIVLEAVDCSSRKGENPGTKYVRELLSAALSDYMAMLTGTTYRALSATTNDQCTLLDDAMYLTSETRPGSWFFYSDDSPQIWQVPLARRERVPLTERKENAYVLLTQAAALENCVAEPPQTQPSRTRCTYSGNTRVALFLVNREGTVVWRSVNLIDTANEKTILSRVVPIAREIPVTSFVLETGAWTLPH